MKKLTVLLVAVALMFIATGAFAGGSIFPKATPRTKAHNAPYDFKYTMTIPADVSAGGVVEFEHENTGTLCYGDNYHCVYEDGSTVYHKNSWSTYWLKVRVPELKVENMNKVAVIAKEVYSDDSVADDYSNVTSDEIKMSEEDKYILIQIAYKDCWQGYPEQISYSYDQETGISTAVYKKRSSEELICGNPEFYYKGKLRITSGFYR